MSITGYAWNLKTQCKALQLPEPVLEYAFHPTRKWRFDFAWPDHQIAAEVDGGTWIGGRHSRGAGYERDCEKLNAAAVLGWRVLRFTTAMVKDGRAVRSIADAVQAIQGTR